MNSLADKVARILPELEARGTVYLFALAERENVNLWDVVLCSEWSDRDWGGSISIVVDLLWPLLDPYEKSLIARISIVPSNDLRMQEMPASLDGIAPENGKVVYASLLGSDVRRAFIFKSQRVKPATAAELSLGVVHS